MCLAIPMKVVRVDGDRAEVVSGGLKRGVNLSLLKRVRVNDYVLLHAGFAIAKVSADEARKTISMARELQEATDEK